MGHSYGTLLWDTLVGHCRTLLWDTLVGHSSGTLLWETLVRYSCRTLLRDTLVRHSCGTLLRDTLWDTLVGHTSSLQNERFAQDFLEKSHVKSPKRAFRRRLPPKVTRQVSKSLQNERFVRDFLKNSHVKICKTSVSYETSSKSQAETPSRAHTSRSPAKQFRDSSPPNNTRSHDNPNVTATFTSTTTHNLTIPCACHESFRVHTSNAHKVLAPATKCHLRHTSQPHDSLRLPRKSHFHTSKPAQSTAPATKSNNIISCELQQNLHHMISTRSGHTPIHQNRHFS